MVNEDIQSIESEYQDIYIIEGDIPQIYESFEVLDAYFIENYHEIKWQLIAEFLFYK